MDNGNEADANKPAIGDGASQEPISTSMPIGYHPLPPEARLGWGLPTGRVSQGHEIHVLVIVIKSTPAVSLTVVRPQKPSAEMFSH